MAGAADGEGGLSPCTGPEIVDILTNFPVTMNNHEFGVAPHSFLTNALLTSTFDMVSQNLDRWATYSAPCAQPCPCRCVVFCSQFE